MSQIPAATFNVVKAEAELLTKGKFQVNAIEWFGYCESTGKAWFKAYGATEVNKGYDDGLFGCTKRVEVQEHWMYIQLDSRFAIKKSEAIAS
jgi:hypothetical protein